MHDNNQTPCCVVGTNSWGNRIYEKAIRGNYVDDATIEEAVDTALACGLTVFDTADDYGFGYAQKLLGSLKKKKSFAISAKYTPVGRYKKGQVYAAFAKTCSQLQTDFLDYYWLHLPNDITENLAEMVDLYHQGKIGRIGISNFNISEAKQAREYLLAQGADLYGVQNHFSLIDREEEESGMLEWCRKNHICFWGWAVLEEGILTGNKGSGSIMKLILKKRSDQLQPLLAEMKKIGNQYDISVSQVAISYCIAKGVIPVCGCRKPYQTQQLAKARDVHMTEEEIHRLENLSDQIHVRILKSDIFRFAVHK